jgi:threonine dehydratase/serine racemase
VNRSDVEDAAARIAPFVARTPVLRSQRLDEWAGASLFVKAEHLQPMGAFKYRGATNAVQAMPGVERGVAAHSSGNHAAALALAARVRGVPAYVVMPEATTPAKRELVRGYGAEITLCENTLDARKRVLAEVLARTGAVEVHPFDEPLVIAGAGTAALELLDEVPDLDLIVTPIGGGGLCAGTCIAADGRVRIVGASPGDRHATIADGLRTGTSERTEAIINHAGVRRVTVDERAIVEAMHAIWGRAKQVIEPSAAIAFAATRQLRTGARVGVICSGGNVTFP